MEDLRPPVPVPGVSLEAFAGGGLSGELTERVNS